MFGGLQESFDFGEIALEELALSLFPPAAGEGGENEGEQGEKGED